MFRRSTVGLVSMVSEHHPSFKATPRKIANTFSARMEVQKINKEIARLMIIRDRLLDSEFHVARTANGMFDLNPMKRVNITDEVLCLRRKKMLLLDSIKRSEEQNAVIRERESQEAAVSA
eukprot:TRINITY_DN23691_c0_g1_i2.p2 TRINITY_DN23691_c0_g1~~TRINITY_DN23691_c0_g1_i2.p2  ORF type:complete len:140 (+),score=23.37 TRINITY_DN23691_c0_g1_i2:61-420(+)